jgi:aspartyl-tRNA(Asn)/glutamyl-tRNA(Gln) amidotransferase subunit C
MQIDAELIHKLAGLSGLRIDPSREEAMIQDLQKMLDFVHRLNEVDTTGVEPLQHMVTGQNAERTDQEKDIFSRTQALFNAKGADEQYFRVPKVIKK